MERNCYITYVDSINGDMTDSKFMLGVFMACNHIYSRRCLFLSIGEVGDISFSLNRV